MKRGLLLTLLLMMSANTLFAAFSQGSWRWRNNDGNETTATWAANSVQVIILYSPAEVLRLRLEVGVPKAGMLTAATADIQYSTDFVNWKNISTPENKDIDDAFVIAETNSFLTKGEATTQQLPTSYFPAHTYAAGSVVYDASRITYPISPTDDLVSEHEIVLLPTGKVLPGTEYRFRVNNSNVLPYTMAPPTLQTAATLPIVLKDITAKMLESGINLVWSTASETNNKFFSVQRSSNGANWLDIAKIDGRGTTSVESSYAYLDKNPLPGANYYRLAQHDMDGKVNHSTIAFAKFTLSTDELTVYPNPFVDQLTVNLNGYSGKVFDTRLTNARGQVVFSGQFTAGDNGIEIKLNQAQKPGVYLLNVGGNGINLVKKLTVK